MKKYFKEKGKFLRMWLQFYFNKWIQEIQNVDSSRHKIGSSPLVDH